MIGAAAVLQVARPYLRRGVVRNALGSFAVAIGVGTLVAGDLISRSVTEEITRGAEAEAITAFMSEQLNVGLTVIGLVISAGAGFLIFNAFAMAVSQRREDLGRLRAVGMTRAQTLGLILVEALLAGVVGAALGLMGGVVFGRLLIRLIQSTSETMNRLGEAPLSTGRLLFAAGAGLFITLLAAMIPAIRASRTSPLAALRPTRPAGVEPASRRIAGLSLLMAAALWAGLALTSPARWIEPPGSTLLALLAIACWLTCLGLALPAFVGLIGRGLRRPLAAQLGPPGRLATDNLRRARSRVTFTVLTLAVGVAMIVGITGYMTFWFDELFFRTAERAFEENPGLGYFPLNIEAGLQAYEGTSALRMPAGLEQEVAAAVGGHAVVVPTSFVLIPELSFLGDRYFSYVLDFEAVRATGDLFFRFRTGEWENALAIEEQGCALLVTPSVAFKNGAELHDTITLSTPQGLLDCVLAGIGPTFVGASIISPAGLTAFDVQAPLAVVVFPHTPADREAILPALQAIAADYPDVWLFDIRRVTDVQQKTMDSIRSLMSGMLVLAVVSAALGVVNTSVISVAERRQEFAVLRATGALRSQVRTIVLVEGLLFGLTGAFVGVLAGAGLVLLYVVCTGGSAFGFPDFPAWEAAFASARPALGRGLIALIASPLLTALASVLPLRRTLRGTVVESLAFRGD